MTYTIDNFWKPLFGTTPNTSISHLRGWTSELSPLDSFVEAPLSLSHELSEGKEPQKCQVLLVSAPGAVGKSTLAKEIAAVTGAVYVDLAVADAVGANTLSGGLAKSGLFANWSSNTTSLLIDGLDEARIRVTQEAFEAFLNDVASLCANRKMPIAMFGRTGSIQEAWLSLDDAVATSVLEIGYFDETRAVDFTLAKLRASRPSTRHEAVEREAIQLLLQKLREQTKDDGDTFSGYAPVLQAVADRVALEDNPSALISEVSSGKEAITLKTVVDAILDRERNKLSSLQFEDPTLLDRLYTNDEQLDRLISRVMGTDEPEPTRMSSSDAQKYDSALSTWVPEHPFLDGTGKPSSAVFEAAIIVRALQKKSSEAIAIASQITRGAAANPFLAEFYQALEADATKTEHTTFVPSEHVGILYASLRARLAIGEYASLSIEADDDGEDEDVLKAEVEITLSKRDFDTPQSVLFTTDQTGILRLGAHVEDVEVFAPYAKVEVGSAPEVTFIAPVSIECSRLVINAPKVIAESGINEQATTVTLVADSYDGHVTVVPAVRGKATLAVTWPNAKVHPWNSFATEPRPAENPQVEEGLRRFRKFIIAFRSHSKGDLARFQAKIDHARMTKGGGKAVLDRLKELGVIYPVKSMYYLDPDKLGAETGATYADCMSRNFKAKTVAFISDTLR